MAKKKKAPEAEHAANHERWMISYADMLTLLLALFIVMFAISKVDQVKFVEFAQGASAAFGGSGGALTGKTGIKTGTEGIATGQPPSSGQLGKANAVLDAGKKALAEAAAREAERQKLDELRKRIAGELAQAGLTDMVTLEMDPQRGLVINILTDQVLFESGHATLRPQGRKIIDLLAPTVKNVPNQVTVEGHTDNVPIRNAEFADNWDLSLARARVVLKVLLYDGVDPKKLNATGYGEQRPIATNDREAKGRELNRRVAIVVLANVASVNPDGTIAAPSIAPVIPPVIPSAPADTPAGGVLGPEPTTEPAPDPSTAPEPVAAATH